MSAIRDFVMAEPLFDCHEHDPGFAALEGREDRAHYPGFGGLDLRRGRPDYQQLLGYAWEDMVTAAGVAGLPAPLDELTVEQFFDLWAAMRTTGYGRATELACKAVLGIDFTAGNADAITAALRKLVEDRGVRGVCEDVQARANIRWVLNDCPWDCPPGMEHFDGTDHPPGHLQALRFDTILVLSGREQVEGLERGFGRAIQRLGDLDAALDDYTEKVYASGRLGAMKAAVAYHRRLDFAESSFADAERAFEGMMQGRQAELRPLHDYLFHHFVQRARTFGLPVQIHTGALGGHCGDPSQGDPALLAPVFRRYRDVVFDLFHAGCPYSEVAGALGKAFPNVYLDMCWAWSLNPAQMDRILEEWLAAVPHNKIFAFGADVWAPLPVVGYALQARRGITNVLERKVASGEYDLGTAVRVAGRIMHGNAQDVYGLPG